MNINVSSVAANAGSSAESGASVGFKVDLSRGDRVGRVSSEWFSRPDDERYLSLSELYAAVRAPGGARNGSNRGKPRRSASRPAATTPSGWR